MTVRTMVVGDGATSTDVLVIGGGPGGYVAAIRAAQRDLDVTLVEKDAYGGTCLNHGCIPSKAFITAADVAHDAGNADAMGIHADPTVDMAGLAAWKDGVVDRLTSGVEKLCKANGVSLVAGTATFEGEHTARIAHDGDEAAESVAFEHCVVATGSRPIEIPGFSFADDPVWTSRDALAAETVPDELVVVGAGYIGMELSTMFAKIGADVTVVEMLDAALPVYDDDITRIVRSRAEDLGVEFRFGEGASEWRDAGDGIEVVTETEDGEASTHAADKVLVAVGRQPVTDTVALDAVGRRLLLRPPVLQAADEDVDRSVGVQREERVGPGEPGEVQLVGVLLRGVNQVAVRLEVGEAVVEPRSVHTCPCSGRGKAVVLSEPARR